MLSLGKENKESFSLFLIVKFVTVIKKYRGNEHEENKIP